MRDLPHCESGAEQLNVIQLSESESEFGISLLDEWFNFKLADIKENMRC